MKIRLASRGGWTATLRQAPLTLDTDQMPPDATAEAERLAVAAESAAAMPKVATESAGPDRRAPEAMRYTITIERDGKEVTLSGTDLDEAPEFAALRDWIEAQSRKE